MLNDNYKFGVEIEFVNAPLIEVERIMLEAGIDVVREGYNHTVRRHWKIVTDQTVSTGNYSYHSGTGNGGELVSPILCGEDGLRNLEAALDALNSHPLVSVDRRCGLHVHVSWDNMQTDHIKEIVRRYAKYETYIDGWMPVSRRGGNSGWCSSTIGNSVSNIREGISNLSASRAGMNRDCKINLDAYRRHGTIEFRHHAGTTDFAKISNWARFLIGFIEASKHGVSGENFGHDLNVNYKRKKSGMVFGEIREQLSAKGWSLDYAGGAKERCRYNLKNTSGETVRNVFGPELDSFYNQYELSVNNRRVLTDEAIAFWNECFPVTLEEAATDQEAETIFRGVPQDVIDFLVNRIAELND